MLLSLLLIRGESESKQNLYVTRWVSVTFYDYRCSLCRMSQSILAAPLMAVSAHLSSPIVSIPCVERDCGLFVINHRSSSPCINKLV